jgi:hypothetical protein
MTEVSPNADGSPRSATVEMTLLNLADDDGEKRLAALAFTSLSLLVEAIGEQQPWVIIPTDEAEKVLRGSGAAGMLIDPQLAGGERQDSTSG